MSVFAVSVRNVFFFFKLFDIRYLWMVIFLFILTIKLHCNFFRLLLSKMQSIKNMKPWKNYAWLIWVSWTKLSMKSNIVSVEKQRLGSCYSVNSVKIGFMVSNHLVCGETLNLNQFNTMPELRNNNCFEEFAVSILDSMVTMKVLLSDR